MGERREEGMGGNGNDRKNGEDLFLLCGRDTYLRRFGLVDAC